MDLDYSRSCLKRRFALGNNAWRTSVEYFRNHWAGYWRGNASLAGREFCFRDQFCVFFLVILAVSRWRSLREASRVPLEGFLESFASAIRYVRHTPAVRIVVVRISLFSLFISMIPALLPVIGLKQLNLNASQLGLLFTSLAIGSVLGAVFVIPTLRAKFSPNGVTMLATRC